MSGIIYDQLIRVYSNLKFKVEVVEKILYQTNSISIDPKILSLDVLDNLLSQNSSLCKERATYSDLCNHCTFITYEIYIKLNKVVYYFNSFLIFCGCRCTQ
jgi:hypothetical protein